MIHRYSLVAKAKTQNLWAFWSNAMPSLAHSTLGTSLCRRMCVAPSHPWHRDISPSRRLAVHGGALTSNVLFESWTSPVEFLYALSTALIDAIPLSVLSKLRNLFWLGSPRAWTALGALGEAVCVSDAKALYFQVGVGSRLLSRRGNS